ncbi:hypothetical protein MtrunA17_Chr3g0080441 [Medicago truncatula]|uniref:Uncharacterized protein n=1 Tax=Medicago truncatula TaxID=3880 RepID=A0A396IJW8_MEDTR|nr:hypothetical protein MtrunA17_Chr3g0080441 [Medicago truncatula]
MVRKGDIVWVREIQFPHNNNNYNWSPALVTSSNHLGISLSFFNNPNTTQRTFFLQSEVIPFDELPFSNDTFQCEAFRSALRLFGLRIVSSLRCRCITGHNQEERVLHGSGYQFDPVGVLAFVLDAAVLPWVEASCAVDAVKVVAQVHAFRHYSSIKQKKVYREAPKLGDNVKVHQCPSLSQKKITTDAIRRLKPTVPDLEGHSVQLFQNKILIIPDAAATSGKAELFMHSPALSPFHIWGKNLKLERKNHPRLKNILEHGMVDMCFENCSRMSEAHFSIASNFKTHFSSLPDIETTICLNRKRKRPDKHALCPQIGRAQENEGFAYISKNTRPRISNISTLEPEESIRKDILSCTHFHETSIIFTDEVHKVDMERFQNLMFQQSFTCESSPSLASGFHSDNLEANASATKVKSVLRSSSSVYQERLQRSCDGDISITPLKPKESARLKSFSGDRSPIIFSSKVREQSETHVPICSKFLNMKFPKNFNLPSKEHLIKKFSVFGTVDSSNTRVFCYTGSARVAFFKESDAVAAYQFAKRKVQFGEANIRFWLDPFEHKRRKLKNLYHVHPSAKLTGSPLKSCLKKSNSLKQENIKKRRVRFTIET